ncbi:MAG: thymidylate kinase [Clostridia bacterium]|nr:thymidylate kinase [Clostridia bacterium]
MGYIIVVEGTDGSGKQTQATKLCERLLAEGVDVVKHSFPSYDSPSSGPVKMYLGGQLCKSADELDAYQTSALFAVDRLCTYQKDLKEHYESGGVIVLDRYTQSNMLHQAGKIHNREQRDKILAWLDNFEFNELKLPRANKVIFLNIPPEVSKRLANARADLKAGTKQDIHEQDTQHLIHAYNSGRYVASKYNWDIVDCMQGDNLKTIDQISDEIFDIVSNSLNSDLLM